MVLEANEQFHLVKKFVTSFLKTNGVSDEIIDAWKSKPNANKLKVALKSKTDKPKRVVSKYLYFCQEERKRILAENPGLDIKKVTCILGKRWQEFLANPDEAREREITQAFEIDQKRYAKDKQLLAPKTKRVAPKSTYLAFVIAEKKRDPKIPLKELGIKWQNLKKEMKDDSQALSDFVKTI